MKFQYIAENNPMTAFGYDFTDGATPDVTEAHIIHKLAHNSHFQALGDIAELPVTPNAEPQTKGKPGRKPKLKG